MSYHHITVMRGVAAWNDPMFPHDTINVPKEKGNNGKPTDMPMAGSNKIDSPDVGNANGGKGDVATLAV